MKTRRIRKTMTVGILLVLLPLYLYADEVVDGPSKKTPEQKEEIIQMLKVKTENEEVANENKDESIELSLKEDGEERADTDKVYFKKGSDALGKKAKQVLNEIAVWLKDNPNTKLIIEGHGNEYKSREKNLMLGELRAGSILSYLVTRGISETRLTAVSYGSERFRNKRESKKYRVKNWRVCFLVIEKKAIGTGEKSTGQEESTYIKPLQKERKDKQHLKEAPKKVVEKKEEKKPPKEPVNVKEEKRMAESKQPPVAKKEVEAEKSANEEGSQVGDKIAEAKNFFEKFVTLWNDFDPKVLDLYSKYAVIYMEGGSATGQNQTGALILETARPILLETLSKAKTQNATTDFSNVKYSLVGKKVRIHSTRNSKPHSMIIGKNANNEWKIEEEVLDIK